MDKDAWYYDEMAKAVAMGTFKGEGDKAVSRKKYKQAGGLCSSSQSLKSRGHNLETG